MSRLLDLKLHALKRHVGTLRRDDNSLAVDDYKKACQTNLHFATIGERLSDALPLLGKSKHFNHGNIEEITGSNKPPLIKELIISEYSIQHKLSKLKINKSTGQDNITLKVLKLAGNAIAPFLTSLYRNSFERETVHSVWKTEK